MSAEELEEWLKSSASEGSGWAKGDGSGESIGHERYVLLACSPLPTIVSRLVDSAKSSVVLILNVCSGRKIIEILTKNPKKDPAKYDEDDLPHMRKVVSYCKRHLAQEEKAKRDSGSKSYKSLKNWGHDAQKT